MLSTNVLRAADSDRRRTVASLQDHFVAGRLDADELGARIARALAARTHGELALLLRDLPSLPPSPDLPAPTLTARSAVPTLGHPRIATRSLRAHAASYASVMVLLLAIWVLTTPGGYFWPIWPMLGWGVGILKHALCAVPTTPRRPGHLLPL